MASPTEAPGFDGTYPSIARVNDFWLEGTDHSQDDQDYAERIELCAPHIPYLVRASRNLTGRMVRYLLGKGVRQFIDLGSGVPTQRHVHEVAQRADPECRVVYVDLDPGVVTDGRRILEGNDKVAYLQADIRDREAVLADPATRALIDFTEPVALMVIETLLYLPDSDDPAALVDSYVDALPAGSYVGMSHCAEDSQLRKGLDMFSRMFGQPPDVTLRERDELTAMFGGLELVEPGVVPVLLWNPDPDEDLGRNPELAHMYAGLGRKVWID
ncbi:S-adenosyl methyltransferase [Amycolatopsis sacchari]|uniref:S-adenosyl methyltransferase n=1 Tax=Amycolatopsis sacchari TaxID=115433 RepID=A0A1I3VSP0_9PSEU|nr:SAM-dependent methyltransferase [Amycolatopsis sacchari]SFJ98424.1 S-adenosyl methyltransferase [Amycolatopsis sacchari]